MWAEPTCGRGRSSITWEAPPPPPGAPAPARWGAKVGGGSVPLFPVCRTMKVQEDEASFWPLKRLTWCQALSQGCTHQSVNHSESVFLTCQWAYCPLAYVTATPFK